MTLALLMLEMIYTVLVEPATEQNWRTDLSIIQVL